ncbi:MAG: PAS domain-containing protein [Methanoregula sp.]|jgi:PAS domain S-box-containing protein
MTPGSDPKDRIKAILRANPRGLGITGISQKARMHRNVVAKYLGILQVSGEVDMRRAGMTKIYTLSRRVPVSAMLGLSEDIIVIIDDKGKILQANEPYHALSRIPADEIIGASIHRTDLPLLSDPEVLSSVKADEEVNGLVRSFEIPGDDRIRHYRIRVVPTVLEGGRSGTTIICADITREEEYKEYLGDTEIRNQETLDLIPLPVCQLSCDLAVTRANRSFSQIFSDPPEPVIGASFPDLVGGLDPEVIRDLAAGKNSPRPLVIEQCTRVRDQPTWFRWHFVPLRESPDTITGIYVCGCDISREKEADEKAQEHLRRFAFLSQKAEEFRNLQKGTDIYHTIAEGVRQIVPDAAVTVSSFDPETTSLTVRALVGDEGVILKHYPKTIGANIPIRDPEVLAILRDGPLNKVLGGVHIASLGKIPVVPSAKIEKELPVVSIYGFSLTRKEKFLCVVAMFRRLPGPIKDEALLMAYRSLATLAFETKLPEDSTGLPAKPEALTGRSGKK